MQATQDHPLVVRAPASEAEVKAYFRTAGLGFWPDADQDQRAGWWQDFISSMPGFERDMIRCAFIGDAVVGGCVVHTRTLRMPPASITTSCIALVATNPAYRRRGFARAVMLDVIARAQRLGHGLLLLGGVPNFYDQFGYVDVLDGAEHAIDLDAALALPPSDTTVRAATLDDAETLRALYERFHAEYPGSFERTTTFEAHQLRFRDADNPSYIAIGADGTPRGYMLPWSATLDSIGEVASDDWDTTRAMLRFQARHLEAQPEHPDVLRWTVPPASPTLFHILDHMAVSRARPAPPYPHWSVVQSQTRHMTNAGWMARPADMAQLIRSLLPLWRARRHNVVDWPERLGLEIDGQRWTLDGTGNTLVLLDGPATESVVLTAGVFTQLLFGFRPVRWAIAQPGQSIPASTRTALEALFPYGGTWIAASDGF